MKKIFKIICCMIVLIIISGCQDNTQNHKGESKEMNQKQKVKVPEADMDTINQVNSKITSAKPLEDGNSEVIMKNKVNRKYVANIEIINNSTEKISFSAKYQLYLKKNNEWIKLDYLPDVGFKDVEYYLDKNETYSDEINLEKIFGKLEKGQYKLEKEINLSESRTIISSDFTLE